MKKYLDVWKLNKTYPTPKGPAVIVTDFDLALRPINAQISARSLAEMPRFCNARSTAWSELTRSPRR